MKLAHLLAGVAAAAVLGGAASAQYTHNTQYGAAVTTQTNTLAQRYFIASERNIASLNSATLTIGIAAAGATAAQWNNPGAATFTVTLQNAVFSSAVNSTALTAAGAAAGCLAGDITVASGGTVGSASVAFSIANVAACNQNLNFVSANGVQLNATNANFNTTLIRQLDGSSINGGAGTTNSATNGAFIQQLPGISFGATAPLPIRPILLAAPTYTTMGAPSAPFDLVVRNGSNLVGVTPVAVNSDLTGAGVGVVASAATASLVLQSTTGLSITNSTIGGNPFGATNSSSIVGTVNTPGVTNLTVVVNPSVPAGAIQTQNVAVQPAVTFAAASGFAAQTYSAQTVGRLTRQGQQTQAFTWVGDGTTTSAISVFRHTGVPASVPGIRFILSNATNGASFNGEYTVPAGAVTRSAGGEVITTSLNLSQIAGNFGRADVVWVFDLAPASPINTQRFVQAPNGTLAPAPEENAVRTNAVAAFN